MRRIRKSSIVSYSHYGHTKVPNMIQTACPNCRKTSSFTLKANYQTGKNGFLTEGTCSTCKKDSTFVMILKGVPDDIGNPIDVYIYDPQSSKQPINQLEQLPHIPPDLVRAYRSALNIYQWKDNAATAVMSKRVIESIYKHFAGDKGNAKPLAEQSDQIVENLDLVKPIRYLDLLLRPDNPFYEILELEKDLDDETAAHLMDLLENLIDYLFVLPGNIEITYSNIQQKIK
ncbi:hypothetical protein A8F94_18720 [Bacillus sp. FJAT-27225]|uniref:hypothetical protein n=1 Tax=Bacillus sp. FJAT-27225 TaxID=1743144 RepID=UPI00080C35AF|nr:hypothetical protein [Bacillus sp. FJAT-27225]OCA83160.1 hypothetical protein A8F94_18720 [Bacillus sp. FJAT-27225]